MQIKPQQDIAINLRVAKTKKQRQYQMLERMWRNQITHTLLLRVNNGAVTVKNILDFSLKKQKQKPVTTMWPSNYTSGNLSPAK